MKNKKYILIFLCLFIFMFMPKDVNATATGIRVYQRNSTNDGWQINANLNTTCYLNQNAAIRGQLIRFDFNDTLSNGENYTMSFNISTQSTLDYAYFRWDNSFGAGGILRGSHYLQPQEPGTKQTLATSSMPMGNYTLYSKSSKIVFDVTPSDTGTFSLDLPTYLLSYTQICLDGYSIQRGSSSGGDSQSIINNNNQNTQTIINNNNQNTSSIIENQNQNTDKEIESQKVCSFIDKKNVVTNGYLDSSGTLHSGQDIGVTDFIKVENSTLTLLETQSSIGAYMCFYNTNKSLISCLASRDYTSNSIINIPNNSSYFKATIVTTLNKPTFKLCKNGNQALSDDINNLNDTLQDTSIDGTSIGGQLAGIESISDTPITDLITLPITLIQNIYNSINGSCSSYSLPFGFGLTNYTLTLPCIDLGHEKYLGRVVWGRIDDLFCIFILFFLFKMLVWFFTNWSTLKDNFGYLIDPSNRGLF